MAEDDGSDRVDPVDVLVAVHVDEPRPLGVIGVYRTDRVGETAGPPADELRLARDQLLGAVVEIEGCLYPALGRGHVGPFVRSYSVASPFNADTIVESLERFDNPMHLTLNAQNITPLRTQPLETPTNLLAMEKVSFSYGKVRAVVDLSLRIARGSVVGLIGPNGSGKSTTLKLASGLLRPDEGQVTWNGCDPNEVSVRTKSKLAYAPDVPTGFDHLTVKEYIRFYAALQRADAEYVARTERIASLWRLDGFRDRYLGELNHGNRRKVAIITASALLRPVTFIDEAINGLDPETVLSLEGMVREIQGRGHSFLIATQNVDFAERLCDMVYLIVNGSVFTEGSPSQIRSEYETPDLIGVFAKAGFAVTPEEIQDALGGSSSE
ncbi:MAG: ABC transporter ATP-binding protein [Dehalococcoidia bacterium]|nr:ABC transporter ATP-binding protein [Dehalococcoidia bacterium]